jgi:hypothetical protein
LATKLARSSGLDVADPAIWSGTSITLPENVAPGKWRNVLDDTGVAPKDRRFALDVLFQNLPVAVLISTSDSDSIDS